MTNPQSPAEVLRAARKLIETPDRWTQGVFARDVCGHATLSYGNGGVCWCAYGALLHVTRGDLKATASASRFLAGAIGLCSSNIAPWNDRAGRQHITVLDRYDRAIALAEQAGQ